MARILVIDDDAIFRRTVATMLERFGHEVAEASGGRHALLALELVSFDLIITELFMAEQDGIETIERIREIDQHVPILAISDAPIGEYSRLEDAKLLGADAALSRPVGPHEFLAAVRWLLEHPHDEQKSANGIPE